MYEVPFLTQAAVIVVSVLVVSAPVFATTIVAIRTADSVVLAADSLGTFSGRGETRRNVCKIHRVGNRFFAIAGLSEDPGRGFSAVAIVDRALQGVDDVTNSANRAAEALREPLRNELNRLAGDDGALLERSLAKLPFVIIIGTDRGVPAAAGFHFELRGSDRWPPELNLRTLRCPGDCPNGVFTFFLGQRAAIDRYVADHGRAMGMSPEDGARFLVRLEIEADTPGVGGPIDAVRVSSSGAEWLSVKLECR